jgi:hypothetical protein
MPIVWIWEQIRGFVLVHMERWYVREEGEEGRGRERKGEEGRGRERKGR